jgi:hypothetical protein
MSPTSIATWLMPISRGFFPSLMSTLHQGCMKAFEPHPHAARKRA